MFRLLDDDRKKKKTNQSSWYDSFVNAASWMTSESLSYASFVMTALSQPRQTQATICFNYNEALVGSEFNCISSAQESYFANLISEACNVSYVNQSCNYNYQFGQYYADGYFCDYRCSWGVYDYSGPNRCIDKMMMSKGHDIKYGTTCDKIVTTLIVGSATLISAATVGIAFFKVYRRHQRDLELANTSLAESIDEVPCEENALLRANP